MFIQSPADTGKFFLQHVTSHNKFVQFVFLEMQHMCGREQICWKIAGLIPILIRGRET
jgi:hypothetical protein